MEFQTKKEFLTALVLDSVPLDAVVDNAEKFKIKNRPSFAMAITLKRGDLAYLETFLRNYGSNEDFSLKHQLNGIIFIKFVDKTISDYNSCAEYAEILAESILEETGATVIIGVGGIVNRLIDIKESYSQALSTISLMETMRISSGAHTYKEFALVHLLQEIPVEKLKGYLSTLITPQAEDIFTDEEMTVTAETFLENNLNASETSRKLYLHRNTLNYRLDKIENATGLNIRKFSDAVTFRLITTLTKLQGN